MAYDLERWTAKVLDASSNSSSHRSAGIAFLPAPSLTLHLHETHCRFEHQNGIFMYDTPVRSLLESIRDARLPVEILDLLDATEVRYTGGCLVVEVRDHRVTAVSNEQSGTNGNSLDSGQHAKAASDSKSSGVLRPLSANEASLANIPGIGRGMNDSTSSSHHPLSPSKSSSPFHASFMTTYQRFEQARVNVRAREASMQSTMSQSGSSGQPTASGQDKTASQPGSADTSSLAKDSSIHSAVLAAVASATANEPITTEGGLSDQTRKLQNAPPVYKIVLAPEPQTLWTDLLTMKKEKQRSWEDDEMVEMEAKILALTAPPLCLAPDPSLARIANTLVHDTTLPFPPYFSTLPKAMRQIAKPAFARKKRKKGTEKDGKAKLVKGKSKAATDSLKNGASIKKKKAKSLPKAKAEDDDQSMQSDGEGGQMEEDAQVKTVREEEAHEAAMAEQEKQDAAAWMRVMDESFGRTFQPNFARIAYVTDWRTRKEAEAKQAEEAAALAALTASQTVGTASPNLGQGNGRPGSGKSSRQHSRAGSVVNGNSTGDIAVLPDIDETSVLGASTSASGSGPTVASGTHNPKKKSKLGNSQGPGKAGSPAPSTAGDTPTSGPVGGGSGLKLTLPGKKSGDAGTTKKKKDKKNKEKQGSPDVPVSVPTPTSAGGPNSASSQQPTPAQQAIMRKTGASLPKAKLKSDIKLPAANPTAQSNETQQQQSNSTGNAGTAQSPVQNNVQIPQSILTNAIPQPQQVQRTFSPMPNMNAQGGQMNPQQQQGQIMGQNQAILNAAQQAYMQHAQANPGIQRPTSGLSMNMPVNVNMAGMNGMNMLGMNGAGGVGMPMSSSPFQQPMQLPGGQGGYNPNPQYNIHRSPQYGMAPLPNQQNAAGGGYNPYAPSGTPLQQNAQLPGGGGTPVPQFSPLQFQQLQNLSAAQNPLMHHQAALQNHVQNFGGSQAMPQQQQNQGMMPMAPPGQALQLNQHMLNQLRQAQQQTTQHVMQHQQQYSPQQQWQPR